MPDFKREHRYIVFKISDLIQIDKQFGKLGSLLAEVTRLGDKVAYFRERNGKPPLECVVVESDWPEYEPTWQAIRMRMEGESIESHLLIGNFFSDTSILEQSAHSVVRTKSGDTSGISILVECPPGVGAVEVLLLYEEMKIALARLEAER